jgi:hypothetical protein
MVASAADVQAIRGEVQALKNDMTTLDQQYKKQAAKRIEGQQKLAKMSQTVQQSSKDTVLVEDIVVITLACETMAKSKLPPIDNPADTRQVEAMPAKVSSADEAVKIYTNQKNYLTEDIQYRTMLRDSERAMNDVYEAAKDEMIQVLQEYCGDAKLINTVQGIAE